MSINLTKIPELHNNNDSFMDVFSRFCDVNDVAEPFDWVDISTCAENPLKTDLTAVDLFCGCGGISKGLEMAGINVIAGLDFFKEAGETYTTNFDHRFVYGDITQDKIKDQLYKIIAEELKGRKLNIVAGGFPCQGFSMAGKRDKDDPRNRLYLQVVNIVSTLKPEFIFLENVKGLVSMDKGRVRKKILEDFKSIGYEIHAHILNSADYEVPQKRERVVFIGNRIGKKNLFPAPLVKNDKYKTTRDAIEDLINKKENREFSHTFTKHTKEMRERLAKIPEGKGLYSNYSDAWKKCVWNEPSCTIKENHGGVNVHPKLPRVLTVRECARIQSFPDNFILKGTKSKQLIQIGNAVPPLLAKAVGLSIMKSYE